MRRSVMNRAITWFGGLGLGAGLMYLFDPDRGRRRRALIRGKAQRALHEIENGLQVAAYDAQHRTQGVLAEMRSAVSNELISDPVLVERVRSALGRTISHPHAIAVTAHDGCVVLSGPILEREVGDLLTRVAMMRGVRSVENRLDVHPRADVPALQGGRARTGDVLDVRQTNWSPTTRLVSGAVGGGLMANCLAKRTPGAILLGTVGFGLFLRSMTNLPLNRLTGIGCRRRAVDVQKTINIAAPVEEVYDFWTNFENFPRFMSHLQEVRDLGNGRS